MSKEFLDAFADLRKEKNLSDQLRELTPQDFIKFGLTPEFIGRLPVLVSLDELDEDALVRILTEPKNSLVKQYKKLMELEGVDLVTEGVVTMSKVLEYAQNYLSDNESYEEWNYGHDGAARICQLLFEEATDINFYVGRAINPAHQNPDLPISFSIKMNIVEELSACLRSMGKRIKVSYF